MAAFSAFKKHIKTSLWSFQSSPFNASRRNEICDKRGYICEIPTNIGQVFLGDRESVNRDENKAIFLKNCETISNIRGEICRILEVGEVQRKRCALCSFLHQKIHLLPPGLAALLRSDCFFAGALVFARMTLPRSVSRGFEIGFRRCKGRRCM